MVKSVSTIIAEGMLRKNTPLQDYTKEFGLWVKREDLACPKPGPPFSKTRGVYVRVKSRPEKVIGVLDTFHSQAGHAVARACQILNKTCINFYPVYKRERDEEGNHELRIPQLRSQELGAELYGLEAGRSCILYHAAKKVIIAKNGYMMPNALKLEESVIETAREVGPEKFDIVLIPASSGTIAAGVVKGFADRGMRPQFIIHLGYSRSHKEVRQYIKEMSGVDEASLSLIDEGYSYKDQSVEGPTPPWPCNPWYDLKCFRWWMKVREGYPNQSVLLWNIG